MDILNENISNNKTNIHFLWGFLCDNPSKIKKYKKNIVKWKSHNPDYNLTLHQPQQIKEIIKTNIPYILNIYNDYPKNIQKCDFSRYILMYIYGGVYADLDLYPKIKVDYLREKYPDKNVFFGIETILSEKECQEVAKNNPIRNNKPEKSIRIANYFFFSIKEKHPIWIDVLELAIKRAKHKIKTDYDILYTTGPDIVSEVISQNNYDDIQILSTKKFNEYFIHNCDGGWRK